MFSFFHAAENFYFRPMHCVVCNEDVQESVSVMRMAAHLTCADLPDVDVKVQVILI